MPEAFKNAPAQQAQPVQPPQPPQSSQQLQAPKPVAPYVNANPFIPKI
jgi:hypothetical protein